MKLNYKIKFIISIDYSKAKFLPDKITIKSFDWKSYNYLNRVINYRYLQNEGYREFNVWLKNPNIKKQKKK